MQLSKSFKDSISAVTAVVSNGYAMWSPPIVNRVRNCNEPSSFYFSTQTGFTYVIILSVGMLWNKIGVIVPVVNNRSISSPSALAQ